jgi:hypothetical protein
MDSSTCAIHQPNLFPRWRTLAKILAADTWVVLDDVQFCRRDYQHRTRLGNVERPGEWQWLTLPVHLPQGRGTIIGDVTLADRRTAQRRVASMIRQYYRRCSNWRLVVDHVDAVTSAIGETSSLSDVAELSTLRLLAAYGWHGSVVRSSTLGHCRPISAERSARLADLTRAAACNQYICGSGGKSYLDETVFSRASLTVSFFELPAGVDHAIAEFSALGTLAGAKVGRNRAGQ